MSNTQASDSSQDGRNTDKDKEDSRASQNDQIKAKLLKRRKRPYTHALWVCEKCRRSHRKCTHPKPVDALSDDLRLCTVAAQPCSERHLPSAAFQGQWSLAIPDFQSDPLPEPLAQFFVDNVSSFFVDTSANTPAAAFWTSEIVQLAKTDKLLRDAMLGLCFIFDKCPRPADLSNADVLAYIANTFQGLQARLSDAAEFERVDKLSLLAVVSFLAVATFNGVGSLQALQTHIAGVQNIITVWGKELVTNSLSSRQFLFEKRPKLLLVDQLPIRFPHLSLLEPLIKCLGADDFNLAVVTPGSIMHLLTLTNKAIQWRENKIGLQRVSETAGSSENEFALKELTELFRDLCEYQAIHASSTKEYRSPSLSPSAQDPITTGAAVIANAMSDVFEQALFILLKKNSASRNLGFSDLSHDLEILRGYIDSVETLKLSPPIHLLWPETIYGDVELWSRAWNHPGDGQFEFFLEDRDGIPFVHSFDFE